MWCMVVLLFGYDVSVIFWCEFDMNLMIKNYDFDRVVLFVDLVWLKSIDFTGVLSDFDIEFLVVCDVKFCGLSVIFLLSSIEALIYKGLRGFLVE